MVIEKINLDLSLKMLPVTVKAKQGDRESRYIEASLFYNNLNYNIPSSATVLISYLKPDKKKVENTVEKENVIGNRVTFPLTEQMLTVAGIANCDVKILNDNGIISTATFKVHVEPQAVPDGAVKSTDEYNALINALEDVRNVEQNYTPKLLEVERKIDSNTQAFNNAVANITVDSEIITARSSGVKGKTFSVLDERLEEAEQDLSSLKEDYANYQNSNNLKIAKVEKELNDYKSTMANVNVNQEAKQSATGYGIVSLPKNAANGQVSVSVKGSTETDEEGNTKSTISAMRLRSVGKNLFDGYKEAGNISSIDGMEISQAERLRTKFIKTNLSKDYVLNSTVNIFLYDENKKYLSSIVGVSKFNSGNARYVKLAGGMSGMGSFTQLEEGTVATPYEPYTESNMYLLNVGELRSLPNGTKDEIDVVGRKVIIRTGKVTFNGNENWTLASGNEERYIFRISDWAIDNNSVVFHNQNRSAALATNGKNRIIVESAWNLTEWDLEGDIGISAPTHLTLIFKANLGITTVQQLKQYLNQYPIQLIYQLAEPIEIPSQVSGSIVSYPNGTIYIERILPDAGVYTDKITILHQDAPIKRLDKLSKVDFMTGVETELDINQAEISEDKLSFTHPDLVDGDIVFFEYEYDLESVEGEATVEFYDSRYVLEDTAVPGKFYKVVSKVTNGVLGHELVEV